METQNLTADVAYLRTWLRGAAGPFGHLAPAISVPRSICPDSPACYASAAEHLGDGWTPARVKAASRVILAELAA